MSHGNEPRSGDERYPAGLQPDRRASQSSARSMAKPLSRIGEKHRVSRSSELTACATTSPDHQSTGTTTPTVASAARSDVTTVTAVSAAARSAHDPRVQADPCDRPRSAEVERPCHSAARRLGRLRRRDDEGEVRQAVAEDQRGEQPPPKLHVAVQEEPRQAGDQRGADRERQEPGDVVHRAVSGAPGGRRVRTNNDPERSPRARCPTIAPKPRDPRRRRDAVLEFAPASRRSLAARS